MMLSGLAVAARESGLRVVEVNGWQTRGHGQMVGVSAIVCHHTATARSASGDYPSLHVVRDGRPGLGGPLAQLGLGRNGTVWVIAAGLCYHAGVVFESWMSNGHAIGIEAEADGVSAWPAVQYDAYVRLVRALAHHYNVPTARILGHKEVAQPRGRKNDPNFDMTRFRDAVTKQPSAGDTPAIPPKKEADMPLNADDIVQIRAAVQAENEEYNARLWGKDGTAGLLLQRISTLEAAVKKLATPPKA